MAETKQKIKLIGGIIAAILIVIIVLQNRQSVKTEILFFSITMPRVLLLMITLLIGFVLGIIFAGRAGKKK